MCINKGGNNYNNPDNNLQAQAKREAMYRSALNQQTSAAARMGDGMSDNTFSQDKEYQAFTEGGSFLPAKYVGKALTNNKYKYAFELKFTTSILATPGVLYLADEKGYTREGIKISEKCMAKHYIIFSFRGGYPEFFRLKPDQKYAIANVNESKEILGSKSIANSGNLSDYIIFGWATEKDGKFKYSTPV